MVAPIEQTTLLRGDEEIIPLGAQSNVKWPAGLTQEEMRQVAEQVRQTIMRDLRSKKVMR